MALTELTDVNPQTTTDILGYVSIVYPNFWLIIAGVIWAIMTSALFGRQVKRKGEGNILSSMSASALVIWIAIGVGFLNGLILLDTFQKVSAFSVIFIGIWFFNKDK